MDYNSMITNMNYFYLNKYEKFTDIMNGEVNYAYFVNSDNMAPIIINDMWNIYYNYIINDKRFPDKITYNNMKNYNDIVLKCNEINEDAIITVTKNITPMFINQFIFTENDPKKTNKVAKAYLEGRIVSMMSYYGGMIGSFQELPKGYDNSIDLMSSTTYLSRYTMDELISNNLKNITKYINNSFICSLTLNLRTSILYNLLINKMKSDTNISFSLPLTITTLNNTDVNILILLKGMTDTLNNFIIETTINTPLIIEEPNITVPIPEVTNNYIQIFFQLNDIITNINSKKSKNISFETDTSIINTDQNNINSSTVTPFYIQYKIYIIIIIIIALLLSCCMSIIIYKKRNNR